MASLSLICLLLEQRTYKQLSTDGSQCLFQVTEFQSQRQSLATCVAAARSSCSLFELWLLAGMF